VLELTAKEKRQRRFNDWREFQAEAAYVRQCRKKLPLILLFFWKATHLCRGNALHVNRFLNIGVWTHSTLA